MVRRRRGGRVARRWGSGSIGPISQSSLAALSGPQPASSAVAARASGCVCAARGRARRSSGSVCGSGRAGRARSVPGWSGRGGRADGRAGRARRRGRAHPAAPAGSGRARAGASAAVAGSGAAPRPGRRDGQPAASARAAPPRRRVARPAAAPAAQLSRPRARRSSRTSLASGRAGAAARSIAAAPAQPLTCARRSVRSRPRVTCRQSSSAHSRSASSDRAHAATCSSTGPLCSASVRPNSSTATAVSECLCTSTPITIIRLASSSMGRPASGQTSLEAKATLLSGHARRSREGDGDTTLASRHQPTSGNRVSRRLPESQPRTRRHPPTMTVSPGITSELGVR